MSTNETTEAEFIIDPETNRMRREIGHDCAMCPTDVRNLAATAHNLVVALEAARRDVTGSAWPRAWRKADDVRRALETLRPVTDAHFEALQTWRQPLPPSAAVDALDGAS